MERIGLCWDLGAGYGHVRKLTALAERLVAAGHEVRVLSRNLRSFLAHWGGPRHPLLQAPHNDWFPEDAVPASHADILWNECGFHDALQLQSLIGAWRGLIETLGLTRLVAEASPLAIAASAGLGLPRIALGSSFLLPPGPPWPVFRDWEAVDRERLARREALIRERLAAARAAQRLPAVAQPLRADVDAIVGHPLFDHYPARGDAHWFELPVDGGGAPLPATFGERPFVFAYLSAGFAHATQVADALVQLGQPALLVIPGASAMTRGRLEIRGQPVAARAALAQASAVVCEGGNLLQQAVAAGLPVLALPTQAEQAIAARRLLAFGAGCALDAHSPASAIVNAMLALPAHAAAARECAARMAATPVGDFDALARLVLDQAPG